MSMAFFRIRRPDGAVRLAIGDASRGPETLLPPDVTIDRILAGYGPSIERPAPTSWKQGRCIAWSCVRAKHRERSAFMKARMKHHLIRTAQT